MTGVATGEIQLLPRSPQRQFDQSKAFDNGLGAGKLAVTLQDSKPEGHFWLRRIAADGRTARWPDCPGEDIKSEMEC